MNKNWDKNGNWIGDDVPDSTVDWSVKNESTASAGDFVAVAGGVTIVAAILVVKIGLFVGMVWFALWCIGVV